MIDLEKQALVEANNLSDLQLNSFYNEVSRLPSFRSPIPAKDAAMSYKFMEDSGCRVTETIHVRKQDINFNTRILTVTHPKSETTCDCSVWKYRDLVSRVRVLDSSDPNCPKCHGKGKWKKPQKTTITPRFLFELRQYCEPLKDDQLLFPIHRKTLWQWGKKAGYLAGINIFQQKEEKLIEGIFLHLFRALCSKRTLRDAKADPYKDQIVACKLRHSYQTVTDRYTKIDINYLWSWEERTYNLTNSRESLF